MGAVSFSIDMGLVAVLKKVLSLDVFVETGTFRGDTVELVKDHFREIHTVELSPEYYEAARSRFEERANIDFVQGDSAAVLAAWASGLHDKSVLYFLDAHWCVADSTAGETSQCPLLNEIRSIGQLNAESLIVIDDARLFLAPPLAPHEISQWPSFNEVLAILRAVSPIHRVMVLNDNIVFFPPAASDAVLEYAQHAGTDWLAVMSKIRDYDNLRTQFDGAIRQLEEKERVIHELKAASENAQAQIDQLESVMQQQGNELSSHKKLPGFSEDGAPLVERDKTIQVLSDSCLFSAVNGSAHISLALMKSLEEKELVIQELAQALKRYRAAIGVFRYLLRPANPMKAAIAGIKNRLGVMVAPRLGNLNQHAPRPVCLPRHYEQAITLSDTPRVSIVTPSFMQARFIGRTIESVLGQSYPNLEYFVQDGGSQDGTVEVLKEYANRLAGWESQPDGGQSQAINLGFAHTTGEIMAWLNSDDMLVPGAVHTIVDYFNRHPEVDVVYGDRLLIDESDMEIGRWIMPGHDSEVLSWADYVPQETLFWRRRIWDKVGGQIDESFKFAMDWDLLVRFRDAGARFAHIPRFLGAFRIHEHQKTSAAINEIGHKEMDRIREKLLGRVPGQMEVRKAVIPFLLKHVTVHMVYRVKSRLRGKQ
jgi:GT2 family glycosyltransferase